jgi:hypothetical protein
MSNVTENADAVHASADRLYWHSREPVDRLAARLEMTRRALYAAVRPAPAGTGCECGREMVFANRKRRAEGRASCPACGALRQVDGERVPHATPPPAPLAPHRPRGFRHTGALGRLWRDLARVRPQRAAMIGGGAALGMATAFVAAEVLLGGGRF